MISDAFSHFPPKHPCPPKLHLNSPPVLTLHTHWEVPSTSVSLQSMSPAQASVLSHLSFFYAKLSTRWKPCPYLRMPPAEVATFSPQEIWQRGIEERQGHDEVRLRKVMTIFTMGSTLNWLEGKWKEQVERNKSEI